MSFVGDLDAEALAVCYDGADVFVLATLQETYGMAVSEALARGLPVVTTTTGAIPRLVGPDAGLLVPPGDVEALADALSRVIGDAGLRARLAAGARRVRDGLPNWHHAADKWPPRWKASTPCRIRSGTGCACAKPRIGPRARGPRSRGRGDAPVDGPLRVLDLGTGTGSNVRYLMDRLRSAAMAGRGSQCGTAAL